MRLLGRRRVRLSPCLVRQQHPIDHTLQRVTEPVGRSSSTNIIGEEQKTAPVEADAHDLGAQLPEKENLRRGG